ncbi:hypothetical protein IW137_005169, partial [Coemansia sp. RSA 1287]
MADGNNVFSLDVDRQQSRTLFRSPSHTLRDARVPDNDSLQADAMPDISSMTLASVVSSGNALGSDDEAMTAMTAAVYAAKSGVRNTAHKRASRGTAPSSRPHTNSAHPPMPGRRPDTDTLMEARAPTPAMYWNKRSTWGERPPQMRSQTMTVIGSNIYVFGGWNNNVCYNDVYVLDTESMFWTRMKTHGDAVPPCRAHTATAVGTRLFVFGGGDGTQYFSDLFVLNVRTCVWERARITGVVPAPRRTHTCFHFGSHVYLF